MLKSWVDNVEVRKLIDNKIDSKTGGEPIVYKSLWFLHDMGSYTITVDKAAVPKIKEGAFGRLLIGWELEEKNRSKKYKPKIYDFNEIKK